MQRLLRSSILTLIAVVFASGLAFADSSESTAEPFSGPVFNRAKIEAAMLAHFGEPKEVISEVVEKAFKDNGKPNAYIHGEEGGGAFIVGLRYGEGDLVLKTATGEPSRPIFWQGPSLGLDFGGQKAKTFVLVFRLPYTELLFQRFPGVEGSAYVVGGLSIHQLEDAGMSLVVVRSGHGLRLGANVGYMKFTPEKKVNPF
jgi:hypothetical protein